MLSRCVETNNVSLVLNFDVNNFTAYLKVYQYRAGRKGRFGSSGAVLTLVDSSTRYFQIDFHIILLNVLPKNT